MSRRKNYKDCIEQIECISKECQPIYESVAGDRMDRLDNILLDINRELNEKNITDITDSEIEYYILKLSSELYYVGEIQEILGLKEDMCKQLRQRIYNDNIQGYTGTVADKTAHATNKCKDEDLALAIYSRAYRKFKNKIDAGYEMLNSLKKVMTRRISELELSNNKYGGTNNDSIRRYNKEVK